MTWIEEMQRTAADLAFPDYVWHEGVHARVTTEWDPGYSELTPGHGFSFTVSIISDGRVDCWRDYSGHEADEFFTALMKASSL